MVAFLKLFSEFSKPIQKFSKTIDFTGTLRYFLYIVMRKDLIILGNTFF